MSPFAVSPICSLASKPSTSLWSCFSWSHYAPPLNPRICPSPPLVRSLVYQFLSGLLRVVACAPRISVACVCWCVLTDRALTLSRALLLHRLRDVSTSSSITSPHENPHSGTQKDQKKETLTSLKKKKNAPKKKKKIVERTIFFLGGAFSEEALQSHCCERVALLFCGSIQSLRQSGVMCAQAQLDVPDCENNDFLQTRMINSIFIYLFLLSRSAAQDQIGTSRSTRPAACGVYK